MIADRETLARQALDAALKTRIHAGKSLWEPICVFDVVTPAVSVRMVEIPTLEAMYSKDPLTILINAHRPLGRQAFSCGHEYGHHVFEHGTRVDKLPSGGGAVYDADEYLADCFAGYLIMPKVAASKALNDRGWSADDLDPQQVYRLGNQFGMAFDAVITHLHRSLKLISEKKATALRKREPKSIRQEVLGKVFAGELVIADQHWSGRPIDIAVGDAVIVPRGCTVEGGALRSNGTVAGGDVLVGARAGQVRIHSPKSGWAAFARVARKGYTGLASYRHLQDDEGDRE